MTSSLLSEVRAFPAQSARVCLGPGAPRSVADFLERAGFEVLSYAQRHHARLYVDFLGARPAGIDVISVDLAAKAGFSPRPSADFACDDPEAVACFIVSSMLGLNPTLVTTDREMLGVIRSAVAVAASHVPVVLSGEVGVGKQSLARLMHAASRSTGAWIPANCSSFEDVDMGALAQSAGRAGAPATLFLDELGELSALGQSRLLELLQAGERQPGAEPGPHAGVRLLAATNRSLAEMVQHGRFRKDLFWRINVFMLEVPPLRQRSGDVALLARTFLRRVNPRRRFAAGALKLLANYSFPGNVLELESVVSRLAIAPLSVGNSVIDVLDVRRHLMVGPGPDQSQTSGWRTVREGARREMIIAAIAAAGGDRAEAARKLGITTRALQYHITKAGLSRRRRRPVAASAPGPDPSPVGVQAREPRL
jgi:transcriptional regulator with GAF, ATPase, and Fis domain